MLLQSKWNMANNLFQFNNWLIKCSKRRLVSVQCREKNNNTENLMFLKDVPVMHVVDFQKPPVGARVSDPGRLSSGKKNSVSVKFCFCVMWSQGIFLNSLSRNWLQRSITPPPIIFPPTCSLFRGNPKGYSFVVETEKCLLLLARKGGKMPN